LRERSQYATIVIGTRMRTVDNTGTTGAGRAVPRPSVRSLADWRRPCATPARGAPFRPYFTSASFDPRGSGDAYVECRDATGRTATTSTKLPALGLNKTTAAPGESLNVSWSNVPNASTANTIALFAAGSDDRSALADRSTTGDPGGQTPFLLPNPLPNGSYELRLFSQKGVLRLAVSPPFTVSQGGTPPTATRTPTPAATRTPTATPGLPTATATATSGPTGPSCQPRPAVNVTVARGGAGWLQVTIAATTHPGATPNRLQRLVFGAATNARIEAGGQRGSGGFTVELPDRPTSTGFVVRQVAAGRAATAPLTVVDDRGSWPTFVGGGPSAV
jgi:hypothetical protein